MPDECCRWLHLHQDTAVNFAVATRPCDLVNATVVNCTVHWWVSGHLAKKLWSSALLENVKRVIHHPAIPPAHTNCLFMDDNAPPLCARNITAGLQDVRVPHLKWSAMSPWPEPHRAHLGPAEAETWWSNQTPKWPSRTACSICGKVERIASEQHHEASEEKETFLSSCPCGKWWNYPFLTWPIFVISSDLFYWPNFRGSKSCNMLMKMVFLFNIFLVISKGTFTYCNKIQTKIGKLFSSRTWCQVCM